MYLSVLLYVIYVLIVTLPTAHLEQRLSEQFMKITQNRIPVSGSFGFVVLLMKEGI